MNLRIVNGSNINSANVVGNKQYVDGRNIQNLKTLGALPDVQGSVADRVDGIIDNRPADGKFEVDELVRVEDAAHFATLFPEEQVAEKKLWSALEWPTVAPAGAAPVAAPLVPVDDSVSPGAFDFTRPVNISDLPQPLQRTAERVELVLNADAAPGTLQLDDLSRALAAPGRFTPADVTDMTALVEALKAKLRGNGVLAAKVKVPDPGVKDFVIPNQGSVGLKLHTETSIRESRSISGQQQTQSFSANVTCARTQKITIDVPAGKQALLINQATGDERIFAQSGDDKSQPLAAGTYRLELWQNGARVESSDVNIPPHQNDQIDLTPFLNYQLEGSGGTLSKNLVDAQSTQNRWGTFANTITASYDYAAAPTVPDAVKANVAKATDSPGSGLLPGRYTLNTDHYGPVNLDVYPENVLRATVGGVTKTMHTAANSGAYYDNANPETNRLQPRITYDQITHTLQVYSNSVPNGSERVIVDDRLRTG